MKLSQLLPRSLCLPESVSPLWEKIEVSGLSSHTERVKKGDLFIAVKGSRFDPKHLAEKVAARGAVAMVTEKDARFVPPPELPCIYVDNIRRTEAFLYSNLYGDPGKDLTLCGVTGTNGKTTTALMLAHLLSVRRRVGYIGTLGVFMDGKKREDIDTGTMTTPPPEILYRALSLLREAGADTVVLEVSSHALNQERVAALRFSLSVFTNLSEDHLDYHGNMERYFRAKLRLFRQSDAFVINVDDAYGERLCGMLSGAVTVGGIQEAAFTVRDLHEKGKDGIDYTCLYPGGKIGISLPMAGIFNVYNSLLATAAAVTLGITGKEAEEAFPLFQPPAGRMEFLDLSAYPVTFSVLIDYAHTPEAVREALRCARKMTKGRLLVLFGAGGEREKEKRAKIGAAVDEAADFSFLTSDNSRGENPAAILRDILSGMSPTGCRRVISNRKKAIITALSSCQDGDLLVLLGKGHETYDWSSTGLSPFSEKEIVFSCLNARFSGKEGQGENE